MSKSSPTNKQIQAIQYSTLRKWKRYNFWRALPSTTQNFRYNTNTKCSMPKLTATISKHQQTEDKSSQYKWDILISIVLIPFTQRKSLNVTPVKHISFKKSLLQKCYTHFFSMGSSDVQWLRFLSSFCWKASDLVLSDADFNETLQWVN